MRKEARVQIKGNQICHEEGSSRGIGQGTKGKGEESGGAPIQLVWKIKKGGQGEAKG